MPRHDHFPPGPGPSRVHPLLLCLLLPAAALAGQGRAVLPSSAPVAAPSASTQPDAPRPPLAVPPNAAPVEAPSASSGMKVNIDPATGRFLDTPAPDAPPSGATTTRAPAAAPAPLTLEPSPVPGGGVGFRVPDGRFDTELKAGPRDGGGYDIHCDEPAR